jgi:mono/diheme cytochrome c family protein
MPQFSDLSDRELLDISQWIHYARMEGRYVELMQTKEQPVGDTNAGKAYFDKTCASCHSAADMAKTLSSVKEPELKAHVLKPAFLETPPSFSTAQPGAERTAKGKTKHSSLLENYSAADVANLLAYLKTNK